MNVPWTVPGEFTRIGGEYLEVATYKLFADGDLVTSCRHIVNQLGTVLWSHPDRQLRVPQAIRVRGVFWHPTGEEAALEEGLRDPEHQHPQIMFFMESLEVHLVDGRALVGTPGREGQTLRSLTGGPVHLIEDLQKYVSEKPAGD